MRLYRAAAELTECGVPFVIVTVVGTQGRTPRDHGAKMLVRADGDPIGSIGGGTLEHLAVNTALECLDTRESRRDHLTLGPDADQCCGGKVDLFFEFSGPRQRVVVFGAGHVSGEVATLLAPAPVEVAVVDAREDWNSPERFPGCRRILDEQQGIALALEHPASTLACVMTCSHDTDFNLLCALLENPPAFVGLIGSRSKDACFRSKLLAHGLSEAAVAALHCPLGAGDTGKEPPLVAISIACQLLVEAKKLAVL